MEGVVWIGGGSGAGKSTVARRLAAEHGLDVYDTDAAMADHARRTTPEESPALAAFMTMGMDERWVERTPAEMLETFHWYRGEGFGLIVEDVTRPRESGRPVLVEGFRLLPRLVAPLAGPGQAVWLLPSPEFRRTAFATRGSLSDIAGRTSDPARALANLLERDRLFTDRLRAECRDLGLPSVAVEVGTTDDDLVRTVAGILGL